MKEKLYSRSHIQELSTGNKYTGIFCCDNNQIAAEIYSYDGYIGSWNKNELLLMRTVNNEYISLHDYFVSSSVSYNTVNNKNPNPSGIFFGANTAIIGSDSWCKSYRVERAGFSIEHAKIALENKSLVERIYEHTHEKEVDTELFKDKIDNIVISVNYTYNYNIYKKTTTIETQNIKIEFLDGVTLDEYIGYINYIVRFFSLNIGVYLVPSGIWIGRNLREEMDKNIDDQIHYRDYSVRYIWPKVPVDSQNVWVGSSLALATDENELNALRGCLSLWVKNFSIWRKPSIMMMECLKLSNEISAERLIAACKWLEEIPGSRGKQMISDDDINKMATICSQEASKLGYQDMEGRICGALRTISSESNKQIFERLVRHVREKVGKRIVDDKIIDYLAAARTFRGKVAHGHFSPNDDAEFRSFVKSVRAVEVLSFLLMACELPLSANGLERVYSSNYVQNYHGTNV